MKRSAARSPHKPRPAQSRVRPAASSVFRDFLRQLERLDAGKAEGGR